MTAAVSREETIPWSTKIISIIPGAISFEYAERRNTKPMNTLSESVITFFIFTVAE